MSNHWEFYFCRVNDVLSSIFVDLGARAAAPDPSCGHLLWVWIPLQSPRNDGLSSAEEAPALNAFEDELVAALGPTGAMLVGRITGAGRREFYFYAPRPDDFAEAVHAVGARFPDYALEMGDQADPQWSQYFDVLYPGPRDFQRMQNRRVIEALEAEGDTLDAVRPVTHWIYFADPAERAVAATRLASAGFQAEDVSSDADGAAEEPGLRIERVGRVDADSIDATVLQILDLLDGLEAEYDGWECPVMKRSAMS
jgi:regulator of RNase E activity RraB